MTSAPGQPDPYAPVPPSGEQPALPNGPYGQPAAPQYGQPVTPQYGQPAAPLAQPAAPQYGQPAAQGIPTYPGAMPAYPGAAPTPAAEPPQRPQTVDLAFWLMIGATAISIIASLMMAFSDGLGADMDRYMRETMGATDGILTASELAAFNSTMSIIMVVLVVIGIVVSLVWVLFMFYMRAGRNWARILLTVLGCLSALSALSSLTSLGMLPSLLLPILINLIPAACWIAAIILMFRPQSTAYFDAVKASRMVR